MDVEILARIQFAFTVAFHYIYPPLSIGIGLLIVLFESIYIKTGNKEYETLTRFWIKIFALTFGIGVATGIIMEFEFGTNWAVYSRYVGDIFGSALAAEGLFAFGLESTFLGVLLFGWNRVKPWVHLVSTIGVFLGSMFSAVWIVVANSWQQTPAGYHIVGEGLHARAEVTDFWAMVFNPSSVDRLIHTWQGAFLAGAFLVLSVHAYYLKKGCGLCHQACSSRRGDCQACNVASPVFYHLIIQRRVSVLQSVYVRICLFPLGVVQRECATLLCHLDRRPVGRKCQRLVYKRNFWRFLTNIKTDAMPFVRLSDYDRTIRSGAVRCRPARTV
jgi:cytochrome bd-type quinol oxidase subunit 1